VSVFPSKLLITVSLCRSTLVGRPTLFCFPAAFFFLFNSWFWSSQVVQICRYLYFFLTFYPFFAYASARSPPCYIIPPLVVAASVSPLFPPSFPIHPVKPDLSGSGVYGPFFHFAPTWFCLSSPNVTNPCPFNRSLTDLSTFLFALFSTIEFPRTPSLTIFTCYFGLWVIVRRTRAVVPVSFLLQPSLHPFSLFYLSSNEHLLGRFRTHLHLLGSYFWLLETLSSFSRRPCEVYPVTLSFQLFFVLRLPFPPLAALAPPNQSPPLSVAASFVYFVPFFDPPSTGPQHSAYFSPATQRPKVLREYGLVCLFFPPWSPSRSGGPFLSLFPSFSPWFSF